MEIRWLMMDINGGSMDRNPSRIAQILGNFFLLFYHFGHNILGHQARAETLKIELHEFTSALQSFRN